jgi:arylsulfatase A-like enzyme
MQSAARSVHRHLRLARLLGIALSSLILSGQQQVPAADVENPPNVLMIVIDDLNDWVGAWQAHPLAATPNLDRLARRGTRFLNAHCNAPLCNPSRTSVMLGLRPSSTGIYGLAPWFRELPQLAARVTLPQYFRQHGFSTATTGKVYHGGVGDETARLREFDRWGPGADIGVRPPHKLVGETPGGNNPLVDWGTYPHRDEEKGDFRVASWATDHVQTVAKDQSPWFLAVGFFLPHVPCYVPPAWMEKIPDDDRLLPIVNDEDRTDIPRFAWYLHWNLPEPRLEWLRAQHQWRNLVRSYLASIAFVDAQVGRVLDALEASGQEANTIVVVWSDHGFHLGEKGISGKNSLWERSTRVPLIFAGPGIAKDRLCREPVELLDLYPTLVELCDLPQRGDLEGASLVPLLQNPNRTRGRPAITTHNQSNHAVRSRDWRYIRYADGSEELYDHRQDPNEFTNLASLAEYQETVQAHRSWLPSVDLPPAAGSKHRVLTYDAETDVAVWEGQPIRRPDPIPGIAQPSAQ